MEQTVVEKNGRVDRLSGNWEFKDGRITLTPCLGFTHDPPAAPADSCDYSVEGFGLSSVEISLDPDSGIAYRR
jgi:hypothetical protein